MIEVYRHKKNQRVRLYKDAGAPLPKHVHKDAWELLRTEESVDSDARQQMEKQGFALARVNLRFDEVFAPGSARAKGSAPPRAGARPGKPAGQAGARPGKPGGQPGGQAKGKR